MIEKPEGTPADEELLEDEEEAAAAEAARRLSTAAASRRGSRKPMSCSGTRPRSSGTTRPTS
jgi:hypothetical protein